MRFPYYAIETILVSLLFLSIGLFIYQGYCFWREKRHLGKSTSNIKNELQKRKMLLKGSAISAAIVIFTLKFISSDFSRSGLEFFWVVFSVFAFFYIPIASCVVVKDFRELYGDINFPKRYLIEEMAQILPNIINVISANFILWYLFAELV